MASNGGAQAGQPSGDLQKKEQQEEMSEEDKDLLEKIELWVQRACDTDQSVAKMSLDMLSKEIKDSTTSLSSIPKPLKFLRPHFDELLRAYTSMEDGEARKALADILSLLAMTRKTKEEEDQDRMPQSLELRLNGAGGDIGEWGHEYVRHLSKEVGEEYTRRVRRASNNAEGDTRAELHVSIDDLAELLRSLLQFHMEHNAEPEAVDLLAEVDRLDWLPKYTSEGTFDRAAQYLVSCAAYLTEPEDFDALANAHNVYMSAGRLPEALRVGLKMASDEHVEVAFNGAETKAEKRQLAHMLARHSHRLNLDEGKCATEEEDKEALQAIMANSKMHEKYQYLSRDLDVSEAKSPEEIYKSHLVEGRQPSSATVESARANLASTFVSSFVNCGFGSDTLMTVPDSEIEGNIPWVYKNKDNGRASAAASLGMVLLWDAEGALPQIDKYLYAQEPEVVAGGLMAVGISNANVRSDSDPAKALLQDSLSKDSPTVRLGAALGLGVAYAGTAREDIMDLLSPLLEDPEQPLDVVAFASIAIGQVYVGRCDENAAQAIISAMMLRNDADLLESGARLLCLGLGLIFLGKQASVEPTLEVAKSMSNNISDFLQVLLDACAYAATGNVLKVQQLIEICGNDSQADDGAGNESPRQTMAAAIGIGLIASGEELGSEMAIRSVEHLLQYGERPVRQACPLALALLSPSNPKISVTDALSRLSHDSDADVAKAAVFALGLVSAGTNNARVAGMLRQLSSYYAKDPQLVLLVRISQGLAHMGKGLVTLSPFHSDRGLVSNVGLAGLLLAAYCGLELEGTLLGKHHYMLFMLANSIQPRMLFTVDEEGSPLPVSVRVGEALDVVGQAGKPKSITGFQTHTTPVILSANERAELATDEYVSFTPFLDGVAILRKKEEAELE